MSKSITQDMAYRQSLMKYAEKYGISRASRKYNKSRSYIYFWKQRWDGSVASLACQSRRPHSHPNQHTEAELKLIRDMRRRNPTLGMVELWHRLRQRGYTRCPESLFRVMRKMGLFPPEKPKKAYKPKPYEQMTRPGERVQVDVKVVPRKCIADPELRLFQYTAILDYYKETFALVQELRKHRRRPTKSGIVSPFSGLLYCADCGEKLYYSVSNNYKREQAYFFCSSYRKNSEVCSAHYIREKVVEQIALESMQRILLNVQAFEKEFARKQMDCCTEDKKKQLAAKHRELSKAKKRIAEIDTLIQKIYEDNASGKLSDERYAALSLSYEEEQKTLKAAVPEMQAYLEAETDKTESLQRFIQKVKQITELKALTPELIHEFVDRIVVYAPRYLDGKRVQLLDIYYSGVGILHELTPEEMEEAFQHHLAKRNKEKTA